MIIIEFLWKNAAWLSFKMIRFFIWLFAARDCKHCKHYCKGNDWRFSSCHKGYGAMELCKKHPLFSDFERKDKPKNFFDIL